MTEKFETDYMVAVTAEIVSAYVSRNAVPLSQLPNLIGDVHGSLKRLSPNEVPAVEVALTPAVPVKKSVNPDYIICLEDGKKFKSLKRHLSSVHGMSPDEYRKKWGLPSDYPMVAPNYAARRSELAKTMGLGRREKAAEAATKRGRRKTAAG
jgi:predicted transcriptional regulator